MQRDRETGPDRAGSRSASRLDELRTDELVCGTCAGTLFPVDAARRRDADHRAGLRRLPEPGTTTIPSDPPDDASRRPRLKPTATACRSSPLSRTVEQAITRTRRRRRGPRRPRLHRARPPAAGGAHRATSCRPAMVAGRREASDHLGAGDLASGPTASRSTAATTSGRKRSASPGHRNTHVAQAIGVRRSAVCATPAGQARPESLRLATQAVHGGNAIDAGTGAIRTPLVIANSYALPEDPSRAEVVGVRRAALHPQHRGQPERAAAQARRPRARRGRGGARAPGSRPCTRCSSPSCGPGTTPWSPTSPTRPSWRLFADILPARYGVEATFVDTSDPEAVRAAMRPTTRLVHTEVIANPTTRVCDVATSRRSPTRAAPCSPSTPPSPRRRSTARSPTAPTSSSTR